MIVLLYLPKAGIADMKEQSRLAMRIFILC